MLLSNFFIFTSGMLIKRNLLVECLGNTIKWPEVRSAASASQCGPPTVGNYQHMQADMHAHVGLPLCYPLPWWNERILHSVFLADFLFPGKYDTIFETEQSIDQWPVTTAYSIRCRRYNCCGALVDGCRGPYVQARHLLSLNNKFHPHSVVTGDMTGQVIAHLDDNGGQLNHPSWCVLVRPKLTTSLM